MDKELLLKYIQGALNLEQTEEALSWIGRSEENAAIFAALKADWVFSHLPNTVLPEEQAKRVLYRQKKIAASKLFQVLVKAAAVLFIPVTGLAFYFMLTKSNVDTHLTESTFVPPPQQATQLSYYTNSGIKGMAVLPDSSIVWLNSCSAIKYPAEFGESREIELSGEAYFEVKGNKDWPMYVKTPKGVTVVVTGTSFNLSSYEDDIDFKLTLVSGNVTLVRDEMQQNIMVSPKEFVVIPDNAPTVQTIKNSDIYYNTAWKEGFLLFENTSMDEVVKKMERWYGVNILIHDQSISDYRFTASFHSESVTRVLDLLKITSNISYRIKDNQVTLFLSQK
jgi:ferric-dicitrate binding protein FerR (iron transport regulator)